MLWLLPEVQIKFKFTFLLTDLAAQYYNLAFVKEIDRNSLVYSTLKPVDLILANSGAPSLKNYHSTGFSPNKQSLTNSLRSNKSTFSNEKKVQQKTQRIIFENLHCHRSKSNSRFVNVSANAAGNCMPSENFISLWSCRHWTRPLFGCGCWARKWCKQR